MHLHRTWAAGLGSSLGLAAALAWPPTALADPASDVEQLKKDIADLRQSYEARLQAMEQKLLQLQQAPPAAAPAEAPPPAAAPAAAATSASAFNPAISLILNGTYAHLSQDPARYRLQGFMPSGGEVGPGRRSFQLGESELGFAATIDPTFSGHLTFSLTGDDSVSVEEAVFERQGVFDGATLKGGRFLSSIGYLNSQHAHAWDFVDAPLAYQAFFGGPLKTDGLHLHWLAPTERFVELGAEVGSGATFPGNDTGRNGIGSAALFAHLGDDIGESASWRAGLSYLRQRAQDRRHEDLDANGDDHGASFSGHSKTWVVDAIYKWAPGGNATRENLKLQGEYFRRTEDGTLAQAAAIGGYSSRQSGWYAQAVYQFMPQWRVGARYDRLDAGSLGIGLIDNGTLSAADLPVLQRATPTRSTLMVDYSLSEFSRFRLQLASDRSRGDATDRQLFLQYIMSLGAHGAHSF
jgi:hypothetical protein